MSAAASPAAAELSVLLGIRCFGCGASNIAAVAPGHEGFRVNLRGESGEGPGRSFALTPDRPARGWCLKCAPWAQPKNTAGHAHCAIVSAAPKRAEWVGEHSRKLA